MIIMGLRVGVTTGIYMAAHAEELATVVRKIGYAFTRGVDCIELAGDVPHEVNHTDGMEIRRIAEHQKLTLTFHGSLTTPMTVAERSDWRDAQDHMHKSLRSAVHAGCKYCLFHACLHYWFELLSYTSGKMEILMCDFDGKPLSEILYKDHVEGSKKLQDWWVDYSWTTEYPYNQWILPEEDLNEVSALMRTYYGEDFIHKTITEELSNNPKIREKIIKTMMELGSSKEEAEQILKVQDISVILNQNKKIMDAIRNDYEAIRADANKLVAKKSAEAQKDAIAVRAKQRMRAGTKTNRAPRKWNQENRGKYTDAYNLLFHYLFFNKDKEPIWNEFVNVYKDTLKEYKYFSHDHEGDEKKHGYSKWADVALNMAEERNERPFKEFFYGVVGARMIQGHMKRLFKWKNSEEPGGLLHELKSYEKDKDELIKIAKEMKITVEIPDARDSKYAGLYIMWRPKQFYALVKTLRKTVDPNIYITWDFEHLAGQGVDPIEEMTTSIEKLGLKDIGKYTMSVHCNKPNPLHGHVPIELGDYEVYHLLWLLRTTGMGDNGHNVYLYFERGGGQDPYKQSVDALKLMVEHGLKDKIPYEELPEETFGFKMTAGDLERQKQIVLAHRFELVKELLETPEEEWGFLSGTVTRKGKTKEWKKNELGGL